MVVLYYKCNVEIRHYYLKWEQEFPWVVFEVEHDNIPSKLQQPSIMEYQAGGGKEAGRLSRPADS